jgi:hypothetical protein
MVVQRQAPAALRLGNTSYPLYRRMGGPEGRYVQVCKFSTATRHPRPAIWSSDRPASFRSLYRLISAANNKNINNININKRKWKFYDSQVFNFPKKSEFWISYYTYFYVIWHFALLPSTSVPFPLGTVGTVVLHFFVLWFSCFLSLLGGIARYSKFPPLSTCHSYVLQSLPYYRTKLLEINFSASHCCGPNKASTTRHKTKLAMTAFQRCLNTCMMTHCFSSNSTGRRCSVNRR